MIAKFFRSIAALGVVTLSACSSSGKPKLPPLKTVAHVDLSRYLGDWYVIANIPYSLENGKVGTFDHYAMRPDGKMDNVYCFRRGNLDAPLEKWHGVAWVHNKETNAEWRVQFIWPIRVPYLIIDLDPDYEWSVIGYPSRKLAWVLCRKPTMDDATYQGILKRLQDQGYDPAKIQKVPQRG